MFVFALGSISMGSKCLEHVLGEGFAPRDFYDITLEYGEMYDVDNPFVKFGSNEEFKGENITNMRNFSANGHSVNRDLTCNTKIC